MITAKPKFLHKDNTETFLIETDCLVSTNNLFQRN